VRKAEGMRTVIVAAAGGLALAASLVLAHPAPSGAQSVPPSEPGAPMTPAPVPPNPSSSPMPGASATPSMPRMSPTPTAAR
jgi:hypothetical protein